MAVIIDLDECVGCGSCVEVCPKNVLEMEDGHSVVSNPDDCIECGLCVSECALYALSL